MSTTANATWPLTSKSSLSTQVNSIERQLLETNTEIRLGNLEEKVFGALADNLGFSPFDSKQ
jgi:hypothetical protein